MQHCEEGKQAVQLILQKEVEENQGNSKSHSI